MENLQEIEQCTILQEDKIKLRREARRRKILENAKIRLEKLNTKQSGDGDGETTQESVGLNQSENCEYSDPEVEADVIMGDVQSANFEPVFEELFTSSVNSRLTPVEKKHVLFKRKVHVLVAVVIGYVIALMSWDKTETNSFSVFVPACVLFVLELTFFQEHRQASFIANILVLLGIQSQKALKLLNFLSTIQKTVANIGIFIFLLCIIGFTLTCVGGRFAAIATFK